MLKHMGEKKLSGRRDGAAWTLGELLRSRREAAGLSITHMARQLGVSRTYLSRLERGIYMHPSSRVLVQMAKRLDIRAEDLYALTGCIPPADLPSFGPYLRAKHPNWPTLVITELDDYRDFLQHKYSLR
jgi:transcriptional regulator with XRE-family HTH domain